jgi:hypothetical protein
VWDEAVDEVLAAHPWNPALAAPTLPVSADYVPQGSQYSQAFEKPADCLRWLPWRPGHPTISTARRKTATSSPTPPRRSHPLHRR